MASEHHKIEERTMRSDAHRNRDRLINATTELILEVGSEPSRDAIARRAGVGIATLYRHFPDQQDLLRAVVLDVLERAIAAGESALAGRDRNGTALGSYLHAAIDNGLGVVNIIHPLLDHASWPNQTAAATEVVERLALVARQAGAIGGDVTSTDIVYAAVRFARPLAIGLDQHAEREIAHRQLDHYLAGLQVAADQPRRSMRRPNTQ